MIVIVVVRVVVVTVMGTAHCLAFVLVGRMAKLGACCSASKGG